MSDIAAPSSDTLTADDRVAVLGHLIERAGYAGLGRLGELR